MPGGLLVRPGSEGREDRASACSPLQDAHVLVFSSRGLAGEGLGLQSTPICCPHYPHTRCFDPILTRISPPPSPLPLPCLHHHRASVAVKAK